MRKQTKIAALVSAAALLAIGASMTSFAKTGWSEDPEGSGIWQYLDKYGQPVYGEWHRSGTGWFYIGYDGYMVTSQAVVGDNGDLYYVDQDGARVYDRWMYLGAENGEVVQEGWYYFNEINGKAVRADSTKGEFAKMSVRKSSTDATKADFVFDTSGRMQTGWVRNGYVNVANPSADKTFYCVQAGDSSDIEVEGEFNYVEGQVLKGWAHMYVPEDYCDDNSNIDDYGFGWYYFDGGVMVKETDAKKLSWNGWSSWYAFDAYGVMKNSLSVPVASINGPATKSNPNASVYFDGNSSYNSGNSWVYDFDNNVWYYAVNLRDEKGSITQRGVKFNSDGQKVMVDGKEVGVIRVKSINGQLYAFDNSGKMLTGDVFIYPQVVEAWRPNNNATGATAPYTDWSHCYWNGISFNSDVAPGWYYFNKTENPQASTAGRMMRNVRLTTYDEDGDPHTRYYAANGKAAESEAYNNYLYDMNGDLYLTEDGDNFRIISAEQVQNGVYVKIKDDKQVDAVDDDVYWQAANQWAQENGKDSRDAAEDPKFKYYGYEAAPGFVIHTSSRASGTYAVYGDQEVLINRSGALIRDGVINIDSETQVTVKNYVITGIKYR